MGDAVLLVRHGPGRGRFLNYANAWVRHAERWRPEVARRLWVHETGQPEPALDGVGAVVFLLADPLRERYPACFAEALRIADAARERGIRLVNPPEALSNTIKTVQASLWQAAGIPCAACIPYRDRPEFEAAVSQVRFPAIVRPDLLHAQQFTFQCDTRDEALAITQELRFPGLVLEFIDARQGWDRVAPGSLWERFYHRYRAFVFGDQVLAQALYVSEDPIVATETSTFRRYQGWGMLQSPLVRLRPWVRRAVAADIAYAAGPAHRPELLTRAVRALGLEFAAIDYALRADGTLVLWEANPHPAMPLWRHTPLPIARRMRRRWRAIHDGAVTYLGALA